MDKNILYITQLNNTNNILNLLEEWVNHLEEKWDLYYFQGYLPKTGIFKRIKDNLIEQIRCNIRYKIKELEDSQIINLDNNIRKLLREFYENPREKNNSVDLKKSFLAMFNIELEDEENYKVGEIFKDFKDVLFRKIGIISDILGIVDFGYRNLLTGLKASAITVGSKIAARRSGGSQIIYNTAECVMFDYVQSIKGFEQLYEHDYDIEKYGIYNGLVVFGLKGIQTNYTEEFLTVVPIFAENQFQYLPILAHEAAHIIIYILRNEYELKNFDICKTKQDTIKEIEIKLRNLLNPFDEQRFYSFDAVDVNYPQSATTDTLIEEILADIIATFIGGKAFINTHVNNYIPLLFDFTFEVDYPNEKKRSSYPSASLGSLKARVCLMVGEALQYWDDNAQEHSEFKEQVEYIEQLSFYVATELANEETKEKNINLLNTYKSVLLDLENELLDPGNEFYKLLFDIIEVPYKFKETYKENKNQQFEDWIDKKKEVFLGSPELNKISSVWNIERSEDNQFDFLPRHLISILSEDIIINSKFEKEGKIRNNSNLVNADAALLTLNYHPFILKRYRQR